MSFVKLNKARVSAGQNIIDIAVQEYGSVDAIFKVLDQNPTLGLSIDNASLADHVGNLIFADNRSEQEVETTKKFFLDDKIVMNEDLLTIDPILLGAYSSGYSSGYNL